MADATEFSGKVVLVTGGSSGIGLATVRRFAEGRATVTFCAERPEEVERVQRDLVGRGLDVKGVTADVTDAAAMEEFAAVGSRRGGTVDILVTCAGIQRYGTALETPPELWDEVIRVNLTGVFLAVRAALVPMIRNGGGAIVAVSSVQAFASQHGVAAYTASKGGINAFCRSLAVDYARDGIRVNVVCPGSVDTPMLRAAADLFRGEEDAQSVLEHWAGLHPLGRIAAPSDVADVIAFLAGERAAFVTGAEVPVDGGLLAGLPATLPRAGSKADASAGST